MLAATIVGSDELDPLAQLRIDEQPEPDMREGWSLVDVRAASINHHDLWELRGKAPRNAPLPRVLGSDAAGVDETGREVIVHALVGDPAWGGNELFDPGASMLSDYYDGTLAERVLVPTRNLVAKPPEISLEHAACLPTAYRMLVVVAGAREGSTVLVQGAGGGVASAAVIIGRALGVRVWVTSRSDEKRAWALAQGAEHAFAPGARLPERVDTVLETVGAATWTHSIKACVRAARLWSPA
jgi:NADPH:quinone reductase-like Zn-dependent oxidoreductase